MNVTDLFIVGIGFDVSGAVLLASGLIGSPEEIVMRSTTWWGVSASIARTIKDKVLGTLGVTYLVIGFLLQAAAYVLTVAGVGTGRSSTTREAWVVVAAGVATVAVTAGFAWFLYPGWVKEEGRRAARIVPFMVGDKKIGARMDALPYVERLELIGRFLDYPEREEDEPAQVYARRVWGVERVSRRPFLKSR